MSEQQTSEETSEETPQPQIDEKNYVIPGVVAQATINYLANQPYKEVFRLLQALTNLQEIATITSSTKPNRTTRRNTDRKR